VEELRTAPSYISLRSTIYVSKNRDKWLCFVGYRACNT
jgi:hypothetical protein